MMTASAGQSRSPWLVIGTACILLSEAMAVSLLSTTAERVF